MKVALISGTSLAHSSLFASWDEARIETAHGAVSYRRKGEQVLINRHGPDGALPPHAINHRANIQALASLGFRDVVAVNSVGSLKADLPPGTWVSCDDYVSLQCGPSTFFDSELRGGAPGMANNLIPSISRQLAPEFRIHLYKVYVQMRGPRFETKAEIRIIRDWGDVVGMTAAHEADLCTELGLNYNSLCIVDNYANGLEGAAIDFKAFDQQVRAHQPAVDRFFSGLLEALSGPGAGI